jgi:hypothetical protein
MACLILALGAYWFLAPSAPTLSTEVAARPGGSAPAARKAPPAGALVSSPSGTPTTSRQRLAGQASVGAKTAFDDFPELRNLPTSGHRSGYMDRVMREDYYKATASLSPQSKETGVTRIRELMHRASNGDIAAGRAAFHDSFVCKTSMSNPTLYGSDVNTGCAAYNDADVQLLPGMLARSALEGDALSKHILLQRGYGIGQTFVSTVAHRPADMELVRSAILDAYNFWVESTPAVTSSWLGATYSSGAVFPRNPEEELALVLVNTSARERDWNVQSPSDRQVAAVVYALDPMRSSMSDAEQARAMTRAQQLLDACCKGIQVVQLPPVGQWKHTPKPAQTGKNQ